MGQLPENHSTREHVLFLNLFIVFCFVRYGKSHVTCWNTNSEHLIVKSHWSFIRSDQRSEPKPRLTNHKTNFVALVFICFVFKTIFTSAQSLLMRVLVVHCCCRDIINLFWCSYRMRPCRAAFTVASLVWFEVVAWGEKWQLMWRRRSLCQISFLLGEVYFQIILTEVQFHVCCESERRKSRLNSPPKLLLL